MGWEETLAEGPRPAWPDERKPLLPEGRGQAALSQGGGVQEESLSDPGSCVPGTPSSRTPFDEPANTAPWAPARGRRVSRVSGPRAFPGVGFVEEGVLRIPERRVSSPQGVCQSRLLWCRGAGSVDSTRESLIYTLPVKGQSLHLTFGI